MNRFQRHLRRSEADIPIAGVTTNGHYETRSNRHRLASRRARRQGLLGRYRREGPTKDIKGQTTEVLGEIDRLLAKCASSKSKLLQCHIWVTDIRNRALMNEVWTEWVDKDNLPARACVEAKLADPKALVEIMVIAGK